MQLEANNYDVVTAANGQEAYDLARRENPDIIILDLMLPKIDGFRVCRMLKFDEKYKKIPVIILTARTQAADKKLGSEVGADCYLTKPFEPKVLLDKVEELLNKGE
ncbi:MAG: hypothetical protein A2Z88_11555 [Omnitrophica WOR_2 bacterium GWA2_47_8]|nr:MAG: hypothetical protein A2Z88_11555 [Omnitrophica WOR_2 bacterium GWA2_47_8]